MIRRTLLLLTIPPVVVAGLSVWALVADAPRRERYERYDRLQIGMTFEEVVEIIGPPDGKALDGELHLQWGKEGKTEFNLIIPEATGRVSYFDYGSSDSLWDQLRQLTSRLGF